MVNNIKNNTISEIDAKKDLNKLNEIKNIETMKYKNHTPGHKELLNLFNDLLDIILIDKTLESESQEHENKNENGKIESKRENEKVKTRKEQNEYEYENEDENEDKYENEDDHEYEYENEDDETIDQNKQNEIIIKGLKDNLDEIIDKSKSFKDQLKSIKKVKNLWEYYFINDFGDKELKFKIFKLRLAHLSNDIDENLFEKIFGHTLIKLADKLINTTNKEENQIIVKNIEKNKDKLFKEDEFYNFVIQPQKRSDLKYTIDLILDFNETIQLDLV